MAGLGLGERNFVFPVDNLKRDPEGIDKPFKVSDNIGDIMDRLDLGLDYHIDLIPGSGHQVYVNWNGDHLLKNYKHFDPVKDKALCFDIALDQKITVAKNDGQNYYTAHSMENGKGITYKHRNPCIAVMGCLLNCHHYACSDQSGVKDD